MSRMRFAVVAGLMLCGAPAYAQNTQRGATLGGIAGAIAGGIIGENNDEAGAGALIGGALGAVAGGVIGNARDQEVAQQRAYQYQQQQRILQQPVAVPQRTAVSVPDVVNMSRSGLSDAVIINHIQQRGVQQRIEVPDIILLHQQGVSETVITTMQQASIGAPVPAYVAPAPAPAPVIVEERYHVVPTYVVPAPRYYRPAYPYYHGRHHHHGGWSVSGSF